MLFQISKNLGKSSLTHIKTNHNKIYKILIKLRFAKINPCEKSIRLAKIYLVYKLLAVPDFLLVS